MRKLTMVASAIAVLALPAAASAAGTTPGSSYTTGFETPFVTGSVNQQDWSAAGSYDQGVVDTGTGQSFRMSNSYADGAFGNQPHSPMLSQAASENGPNRKFTASFDFKSMSATEQKDLAVSVSPDDGNGGRMSYVRLDDKSDGIHVIFGDVSATINGSDAEGAKEFPGPAGFFQSKDIATVNRTGVHTIKFIIDMKPGRTNDGVTVYVDGIKKATGKSWENYYRLNQPEQSPSGNVVPPTNSLIFMARGTGTGATAGGGYLFDNVSYSSSK